MKNLIKTIGLTVFFTSVIPSCSMPILNSYLPTTFEPCIPKNYNSKSSQDSLRTETYFQKYTASPDGLLVKD